MSTASTAASVSYSITIRLELPARPTAVSELTHAIEVTGGVVTALDVTASGADRVRVDVTCATRGGDHATAVVDALRALDGVDIDRVSDRTFLVHLGGKLRVESKVPIRNRDDLSLIYTPGVGRICEAIAANPEDARRLTIKRNTVAVVTDGSAILGLGNLGPLAALPVMEGKAALFKRFADIDAFPICLDTQDTDEIVKTVMHLAPGFAGINLEDISAPRCFEIEDRLKQALEIPVFHDDQHGTAVVALAAFENALKLTGRLNETTRVVISGAGAAGVAVTRILLAAGVHDIAVVDRTGVLHSSRDDLHPAKRDLAKITADVTGRKGSIAEVFPGADVYIGVSGGTVPETVVATMAEDPIIFALANPHPEVAVPLAKKYARIVATGRSDFPNQINNVLAFPGIFRGAFDVRARAITEGMKLAAANAIAGLVGEDLRVDYIVPSPFDPRVGPAVAAAVAEAARRDGVARR